MANSPEHPESEREAPLLKRLLDSPFILLAISLLIVFSSYTIWGTIELLKVVPAGR